LVYCSRWNPEFLDQWQVLPSNCCANVPVLGQEVFLGDTIRLKHLGSKKHLHSLYGINSPKSNQSEVVAFGSPMDSNENDHWIIKKWSNNNINNSPYGNNQGIKWTPNEIISLTHYVSNFSLHSHDILFENDVQEVTVFSRGIQDYDRWAIELISRDVKRFTDLI
jgi:dolichyl-phosphate-mannose--protein O-mannosyl transferase